MTTHIEMFGEDHCDPTTAQTILYLRPMSRLRRCLH